MGRNREDLHEGFTLQGTVWLHLSPDDREARGWYPNHSIKHATEPVIQVASVRSGPYKDWSLNRAALEDHETFQDNGKVARAYVTLWNEDYGFIARDTVKNVLAKLRNTTPRVGDYGDYWWVDAEFNPVGKKERRKRVYADSEDWP